MLAQPERIDYSMDKLETTSLSQSCRLSQNLSAESAGRYVSIYLSKTSILEAKIAEGVVDKNPTRSCKESRKLIIRDLKTIHKGRRRFNLLDFFYGDKTNIRI